MTIEEAIKRIEEHKAIHHMNEPQAVLISEALDMAIDALEQPNDNTAYWKDNRCTKCGKQKPPKKISYLTLLTYEYDYDTNFCTHCGARILGVKHDN